MTRREHYEVADPIENDYVDRCIVTKGVRNEKSSIWVVIFSGVLFIHRGSTGIVATAAAG